MDRVTVADRPPLDMIDALLRFFRRLWRSRDRAEEPGISSDDLPDCHVLYKELKEEVSNERMITLALTRIQENPDDIVMFRFTSDGGDILHVFMRLFKRTRYIATMTFGKDPVSDMDELQHHAVMAFAIHEDFADGEGHWYVRVRQPAAPKDGGSSFGLGAWSNSTTDATLHGAMSWACDRAVSAHQYRRRLLAERDAA